MWFHRVDGKRHANWENKSWCWILGISSYQGQKVLFSVYSPRAHWKMVHMAINTSNLASWWWWIGWWCWWGWRGKSSVLLPDWHRRPQADWLWQPWMWKRKMVLSNLLEKWVEASHTKGTFILPLLNLIEFTPSSFKGNNRIRQICQSTAHSCNFVHWCLCTTWCCSN